MQADTADAVADHAEDVRRFLKGGRDGLRRALTGTGGLALGDVEAHLDRYLVSLAAVPPAEPGARLLDIGTFPALLRILACVWGYEARACTRSTDPETRYRHLEPSGGLPEYTCEIDSGDAEMDRFPYEPGTFDAVTCWEVIEHLGRDPMHMLWEVNRILKPGGVLVLTTPNIASLRSIRDALNGDSPYLFAHFAKTGAMDRHMREYTPKEIRAMLAAAGFSTDGVETRNVWGGYLPDVIEKLHALGAPLEDRGDDIIAVARKAGLPAERFPDQFYI
jgi:2-polyprenyl-3-methyl-5-hydroxy-6-metoxy-1,4-benzoquinol methylase